jgi:hypothetical protein
MSNGPDAPEGAGAPRPRGRQGGAHLSPYQPKPWVAGVLLVLFVVTIALVMANVKAVPIGGTSVGGSHTTTSHPGATTTTLPRSRVTVQVANGTSVHGLAATYTNQLLLAGWNVLAAINGPATPATKVFFKPGFGYAATEIAQEIKVPHSAVTSLAQGAAVISQIHYAPGTDVIVLLGPDAAQG